MIDWLLVDVESVPADGFAAVPPCTAGATGATGAGGIGGAGGLGDPLSLHATVSSKADPRP